MCRAQPLVFNYKSSDFTEFCYFFVLMNVFLGWVCCAPEQACFLKEGGMHMLAGLAPSWQTVGYLLMSDHQSQPEQFDKK